MSTQTNDPNPKGTEWWNNAIYGNDETIFPEEDYQIKALPKRLLHLELGQRLNVYDSRGHVWQGKTFDLSAITNGTLLHYISNHLNQVDHDHLPTQNKIPKLSYTPTQKGNHHG